MTILFGRTSTGLIVPVLVTADGELVIEGSSVMAHSLLDGSVHSDTIANSPAEGDIIVGIDQGDGVIKWDVLSGGNVGDVLTKQADGSLAWAAGGGGGYTQGARVYHSVDQSIPNNALTAVAFDSEDYDTDTIHSTVTNNSRLTCKTAGKYLVVAQASYASNATGLRAVVIRLNGATSVIDQTLPPTSGTVTRIPVATIINMAINDYVEFLAYQNSGGALNLLRSSDYSPIFSMQRIG